MRRCILTGAPGAGKTTLIEALAARGVAVVREAATDVIAAEQGRGVAEPWTRQQFVETIARLQLARQAEADAAGAALQFHDRSLVCTHALAVFLGFAAPDGLEAAIAEQRARREFGTSVLLIGSLGFVTPTAARRIDLAEALRFEAVHVDSYRRFGYDLVRIGPASVEARLDQILALAGR